MPKRGQPKLRRSYLTATARPGIRLGNRPIQQATRPLEPIVNILTTPLPVISDLSGHDVTLIDIARIASKCKLDIRYIKAAAKVIRLINSVPTVGDVFIPLGGLVQNHRSAETI